MCTTSKNIMKSFGLKFFKKSPENGDCYDFKFILWWVVSGKIVNLRHFWYFRIKTIAGNCRSSVNIIKINTTVPRKQVPRCVIKIKSNVKLKNKMP